MNSNTKKRQAKIRKESKADNNRPRRGVVSASDTKNLVMIVSHNTNEQGTKQSITRFEPGDATQKTYRRTFKAMKFDTEGE